jgi:N-acetyl-gamma-glutamyl-phosphate reductase
MTLKANLKIDLKKISCSIVGARGYAGLELAKLLIHHPGVDLKYAFATTEFQLSDYLSSEKSSKVECLLDSEIMTHLTDVVFLATPAEVSLKLAPQILSAGKKVIDLSGAFRLKKHDYKKWYGFSHSEPAWLKKSSYGLMPWVGPHKSQNLIANPGCYATAISMALLPLIKANLINNDHIVIDAKSGATGAGRKATENLLFAEVDGECSPYKVGRHQHEPEIIEVVEAMTGIKIQMHMTTSLLPIRRGIIAGVYATLASGKTADDVASAFTAAYGDYSLVKHTALTQSSQLLSLKKVVGTAKVHISYEVVGQKLFVFSCIDNLLKGAASQAVENLNRCFDWPSETGLKTMEVMI